jgi:hypothetical protein
MPSSQSYTEVGTADTYGWPLLLLGLDSYLHSRWQILMGNSIVQVNLQPGSKRSCILWNPSGKPQEPMVVVVLHM